MKQFQLLSKIIFISSIIIFTAAIADAQATRTWVSGVGDDVNPCSRTAPCKTFAGAISKTATNGEINCLDPAGYGAVTITKSITIDCEDTQGSILASLVNGIIVNSASASVRIRGISINGAGNGINGIRVLAATKLVLEEVVIDNFSQHGVSIETTSGTPKVIVDRSTFRNNTGNGINSFITGGTVSLVVSNSRFMNNATGFNIAANTKASVSNSTIAGNTTGVVAGTVEISVSECLVSNNGTGISSLSGGTIRLTGNTITANTTGLSSGGGAIVSYSSNMLNGNVTDGSPTSTIVLQ